MDGWNAILETVTDSWRLSMGVGVSVGIVIGSLVSAISFMVGGLHERCKPIYLHLSNWKLEFQHIGTAGSPSYDSNRTDAKHARYMFDVTFFNKKTQTVALHGIRVEFRRGIRYSRWTRAVHEDAELRYVEDHMRNAQHLVVLELPSHESVVETIAGFVRVEDFDKVAECDSVWLVAQTTERRRKDRHWLVGRLKRSTFQRPVTAQIGTEAERHA